MGAQVKRPNAATVCSHRRGIDTLGSGGSDVRFRCGAYCHAAAVLFAVSALPLSLVACGGTVPSGDDSPSPTLTVTALGPGDRVTLASGLTMRVPPGVHGDVARHLPGGPSESLGLLDEHGEQVLLVESLTTQDLEDSGRALTYWDDFTVVARSPDGRVQVLWKKGNSSRVSVVAIITMLPDKPRGELRPSLKKGAEAALTEDAAYDQAVRLWALLSVEGAELPTRVSATASP